MKKILSSIYFFVPVYCFLAFLTFGSLPLAFFQQDEWAIIGIYSYFDKVNLGWFDRLFTYGQNTHTIPLSGLLSNLEYKLFGLDFASYAYASIAMHLVNVGFAFYLAYLFFRRKLPAFIASLIFLVDFIPSQGITWIATTSSTAGATVFTLLSIIFLTKFILYKNKKKLIVLSLVFFFMALLFKESSVFLFLFLPFYWLVFDPKKNYKRVSSFLFGVFIVGLSYILPRLLLMLFNTSSNAISDELSKPTLPDYFYRIFTLPLKSIAQSIIPVDQIVAIADKLVGLGYPQLLQNRSIIAQSIGSDLVSYFFALTIILVCVLIYRKAQKQNMVIHAKVITISIVFIALSSLPLIFIPGKPGYFSLFDGRYLYLGNIFKSILLANISLLIYTFFGKKKIVSFFLILFFTLFTAFNILNIRKGIEGDIIRGDMRKLILNQIKEEYPKLPDKVVFYTESNTAHYGLPVEEKIMPFFSGFGQTLLVWYEGHGEDFPECFFQDKYLYAILEEGYKECGGKGYGYFRKLDSLKEAVRQYKIDPDNVISFRYTSGEEKLEDISMEVRKELSL